MLTFEQKQSVMAQYNKGFAAVDAITSRERQRKPYSYREFSDLYEIGIRFARPRNTSGAGEMGLAFIRYAKKHGLTYEELANKLKNNDLK